MSFNEHTRQITPPIASYPTKTLFQVLRAVFKGGLYLTSVVILHGNPPATCIHPASDEVVVVGIELEVSPSLIRETIGKSFVLKDAGTICDCST